MAKDKKENNLNTVASKKYFPSLKKTYEILKKSGDSKDQKSNNKKEIKKEDKNVSA